MNPVPTPSEALRAQTLPQVWFPDTSAIVTLAVHEPLHATVVNALSSHRRVLVQAVDRELRGLARTARPTGTWAKTALEQLDWLGTPVRLVEPDGVTLAVEIQEQLAAGRALRHDLEHFGESAIIAMASRLSKLRPLMLTDDYDARVIAKVRRVGSVSVRKFLHLMVQQGKLSAETAASFTEVLFDAGRGPRVTAAEFEAGRIGRAGLP